MTVHPDDVHMTVIMTPVYSYVISILGSVSITKAHIPAHDE